MGMRTDSRSARVEGYPVLHNGEKYICDIDYGYVVKLNISTHSHNCPMGEDYPDDYSADCQKVEIDSVKAYDEDGEPYELKLTETEEKALENSLFEEAESDYCDNGDFKGDCGDDEF